MLLTEAHLILNVTKMTSSQSGVCPLQFVEWESAMINTLGYYKLCVTCFVVHMKEGKLLKIF